MTHVFQVFARVTGKEYGTHCMYKLINSYTIRSFINPGTHCSMAIQVGSVQLGSRVSWLISRPKALRADNVGLRDTVFSRRVLACSTACLRSPKPGQGKWRGKASVCCFNCSMRECVCCCWHWHDTRRSNTLLKRLETQARYDRLCLSSI